MSPLGLCQEGHRAKNCQIKHAALPAVADPRDKASECNSCGLNWLSTGSILVIFLYKSKVVILQLNQCPGAIICAGISEFLFQIYEVLV